MDPNGWMFETILRVVWRIRNRYGERDGLLENLLNLNLIMDFS